MKTEPREVWEQRVQRLADSGLTTKEFASEIGVNPHTLAGWKWRLTRAAVEGSSPTRKPRFVEVTSEFGRSIAVGPRGAAAVAAYEPFEVVLVSGTRIRVPPAFEAGALRCLLATLEGR